MALVNATCSCPHCGGHAIVQIPATGSGTKSGIAHFPSGCNKTFSVRYENGVIVRVDR
jgi:hypothetical protein